MFVSVLERKVAAFNVDGPASTGRSGTECNSAKLGLMYTPDI